MGVVGPKSMALLKDVGHRIVVDTGCLQARDYFFQCLLMVIVQVLDLHMATAGQVNEPLPSMTSALHKPSSIITYRNSNTLPSIIQSYT